MNLTSQQEELARRLRKETDANYLDCIKSLIEKQWDYEEALRYLRYKYSRMR